MSDGLKITLTIENIDEVQATIEIADKAISELKAAMWKLSSLKTNTAVEKDDHTELKNTMTASVEPADVNTKQPRLDTGLSKPSDPVSRTVRPCPNTE